MNQAERTNDQGLLKNFMPNTDITVITLKLQKPEVNLADMAGGDQSCTELDRRRDMGWWAMRSPGCLNPLVQPVGP